MRRAWINGCEAALRGPAVIASLIGRLIDLVVLKLAGGSDECRAEAWITPGPEYRPALEFTLAR